MSTIDLRQFHRTFFEESFEGLDVMEAALLHLDPAQVDNETINGIFRAAHSIKGGAGTFGFEAIAAFTHLLETLLDDMRAGKRAITVPDTELMLRAVDALRGLLSAARDGTEVDVVAVAALRSELEQCLTGKAPVRSAAVAVATASGGWRIRFAPKPELFASGNDPLLILRELQQLGDATIVCDVDALPPFADLDPERCHLAWTVELRGEIAHAAIVDVFTWVEDDCELTITPLAAVSAQHETVGKSASVLPLPAPASPTVARGDTRGDGGSIRVATAKIDALINLVGELVITQAMLQQLASQLDPVHNEALLQGLSQLDRNTRVLQEAVMSTRMLPVDAVFSRFPRVVHDLAGKLGKQVRLQLIGESTELDKSVIEKISDPLTHLVRNSLDHGLETPDERRAAGKDVCGTVTLKASHQGGHIVIEVADDGRGLNRAKLLAKAVEKGIVCNEQISDAEVWQLIFAPGFSTAAQLTDVSGRGVGMDVVKKNIQALGGSVELASRDGAGTRVTIRLPLTLAILDGMSVAVGDDIYILPLSGVVESLQPSPDQIRRVAGDGTVVRVRNEYVPLLPVREWFRVPGAARPPHESILVLVEADGHKLALQVDDLVGQQQVVIKSLEANYKRIAGISGATILGDGRVALILDIAEIVRLATRAVAA